MSHSPHLTPRRVLGDDCEECVMRSQSVLGLTYLDASNMRRLADLATETRDGGKPDDASWADMKAVDTLRMAARVVYRSGIDPDVAS